MFNSVKTDIYERHKLIGLIFVHSDYEFWKTLQTKPKFAGNRRRALLYGFSFVFRTRVHYLLRTQNAVLGLFAGYYS